MEEQTIFDILHNMDKVTNNLIVQWNKHFDGDLGVSHILVLGHLRANGPKRPSDLARILGLTPPTMTHLSEKLVKRGLAERTTCATDRRMIFLAITEAGEETVDVANVKGQELRKQLFLTLTSEEKSQLLNIYQKLSKEL